MKTVAALLFALVAAISSFSQNEQAPIVEKEITYKNWEYKDVRTGEARKLRDLIKDKKLTAVVYFAPWCGNWRHDAPMLERLYQKYHASGFEIVAVGEYDPVASMKTNIDTLKVSFPVVYESENRDQREKTLHAEYRKATGDTRKWGSPWYVFLENGRIEKKGDNITKKTHVINGEMIELEGERFIREKLGLTAADTKTAAAKKDTVEACDPNEKKSAELKKP